MGFWSEAKLNFVVKWFAERKLKEVLTMPFLAGYKTYIVGALIGLVTALDSMAVIPPETAEGIRNFLYGLGFVTLRAGISGK